MSAIFAGVNAPLVVVKQVRIFINVYINNADGLNASVNQRMCKVYQPTSLILRYTKIAVLL